MREEGREGERERGREVRREKTDKYRQPETKGLVFRKASQKIT